ncbi:twin-arginine translocase subunit TatB [Permianibacter sp. IMCC34836]|uniref:Sec-independent protein translocase protein TatB n=1 Tax=Permianibacter fluminis TaxID=2738515 RepID=UPI001551AE2F|nr:Sec-independent protein translocase protein TatB [Permianibacter fluminis]NQD36137.1 twin-arginine translocase subunit TatB [Permianibacter fluminis]
MFDVGFTELVLIGLVALLVLGPTKMLELSRIAGRWAGRLRRQFNEVKDDIDRELKLEDMRRKLAEEERALRDNLDVKAAVGANLPSIDPLHDIAATPAPTPAPTPTPATDPKPVTAPTPVAAAGSNAMPVQAQMDLGQSHHPAQPQAEAGNTTSKDAAT